MATTHIDINLLTEELALQLAKLGRALTAIELHHFVMDKIGEKYPTMPMGVQGKLVREVLSTMNAYRFEADERAKRQKEKIKNFANAYGRQFSTTDWEAFVEYNRQDVHAQHAFDQRMYEAYVNGTWGGNGDDEDNDEGTVDFDEEELVDAFSYKGLMWKAPKGWTDYRKSRGDFMGGFTRIPAGARIKSRIFEALPFTMIKN